jgi:hypothetical protein
MLLKIMIHANTKNQIESLDRPALKIRLFDTQLEALFFAQKAICSAAIPQLPTIHCISVLNNS